MPEVLALLAEDPRAVGPYRLEGRLGVGGQGTVYVGRGGDGVRVAVKLLHPHLMADEREHQRIRREVETVKRVAPFCAAQVLDFGFVGGRPYIVSEFVDGPSLQDAVRDNGPRGAAALQRLAVNTATALIAIHEAGVVHRDFKPGNVLLGPDGPVVIDFGIARALDLGQSVVSSQPLGSPAYMAPEQIAGGVVGPAADVFAWAATMVYAATGQRAFVGETIPGILHTILQGEPNLGGLAGGLRDLLVECLAKDPARRPTASLVIDRLRGLPAPAWQLSVLDDPSVATTPVTREPTTPVTREPATPAPPPRRRRGLLFCTAGAALLVVAGIGYFTLAPIVSGKPVAWTGQAASTGPASTGPSSTGPSSTGPSSTGLASTGPSSTASSPADPGTPTPRPSRRTAKAVPSTVTTPMSTPAPTRRTPRSSSPVEPSSAAPTKKPTRRPVSKPTKTTHPQTSGPPQPAEGSITFDDAGAYCQARGQSMAGGNWDAMWCLGGDSVTPSTICQWKYPGRDAVAERPENAVAQQVTCRLS